MNYTTRFKRLREEAKTAEHDYVGDPEAVGKDSLRTYKAWSDSRERAKSSENRNLADLLTGAARNCWLALSGDETKIVGKGQTLEEAMEAANKAGEQDPVIVWAPKAWRHSA